MSPETIESQPTTPEVTKPRDRRALNAYRHGLTGQIRIDTPEDKLAYEKHCKSILDSLAPAEGIETDLAQAIADDRWRLNHGTSIENAIVAIGLAGSDAITASHPEVSTAFARARIWLDKGGNLNLLSVYEGRLQRKVEKNMKMLHELQDRRQAALNQAVEEAALLMELAESKGETFDPERDIPLASMPPGFVFSTTEIHRLATRRRRLEAAKKQFAAPQKPVRKAA